MVVMFGRAVLVVALALVFSQQAIAQDATPASGVSCEGIEPRDAEFFSGLTESSGEVSEPVLASPGPDGEFTLPEGEPADEETVAGITQTYEALVACTNTGDYLRIFALYTDDYLIRNLDEAALEQLDATPAPVEASTESEFGGVLEARQIDEDHVAALVSVTNQQSGEILILATLVRGDAGWLINEEAVVETETPESQEATGEATPAA